MMRTKAGIALLAFAVVACAGGSDEAADAAADSTAAMAPAPPPPAPLGDPEIAHVAVTSNDIDIAMGELANSKSQNKEIKAFAATMIRDHTGVNKQATDLATKLGVTPADNADSQSMKATADQTRMSLTSLSGADFDRAYIANEVGYHQAVLDALDTKLIPGTQNAELKALLEGVRPAVAGHLKMAQDLQTKLASTTTN